MHVVKTKFRPWLELEVDDAEYADLKAMGALAEDAPQAAPAAKPSPTPAPDAATPAAAPAPTKKEG